MLKQAEKNLEAPKDDGAPTRRHRRWYVEFEAWLAVDGKRHKCTVYDFSPSGACVALEADSVPVGTALDFELPGYGVIPAEVRYDRDGYQGVMFLHDEADEVDVARYLVGVEQNRRAARRHDVDIEAILLAGGIETECVVSDLSRNGDGLMATEARHLNAGQQVSLYIMGAGFLDATVQRVQGGEIGVVFLTPLAEEPAAPAIQPTWFRGVRGRTASPELAPRKPAATGMLALSRIAVPELATRQQA
ncbi:MAG: PilZ domain-containing protein [Alphaproteobacteria bacterium]|jgi:hypothetical protein|nr:PilZ domain-containing protein [Alphaproteobacteria bacterium]